MRCSPSAGIVSLDYQSPHKNIGTSYSLFPSWGLPGLLITVRNPTLVSGVDGDLRCQEPMDEVGGSRWGAFRARKQEEAWTIPLEH